MKKDIVYSNSIFLKIIFFSLIVSLVSFTLTYAEFTFNSKVDYSVNGGHHNMTSGDFNENGLGDSRSRSI